MIELSTNERNRIEFKVNRALESPLYSETLFYVSSLTSIVASAIFVVLISRHVFSSRLPYVDEREIAAMNARATANVAYSLVGVRRAYRFGGLLFLIVFLIYFVLSRVGVKNVGIFVGKAPYLVCYGVIIQLIMQFILWNFVRHPFFFKANKKTLHTSNSK